MSEDRLHVVFGAGQVGRALAARLAGLGLAVRAVSRSRPPELRDGVDWRAADASDPDGRRGRGRGRVGRLPVPERAVHRLAGALPAAAARSAERSRAQRCAAGEPGEPLRLRPDRRARR